MTRKHRKIYKQGKRDGYIEGYAKGLHDGNPFGTFCESLSKVVDHLSECSKIFESEEPSKGEE